MAFITKQSQDAAAEHKKKITVTYSIFTIVFLCMALINIYSYFTIINMNKMATSLNSAALNVKLEATNANLLFREIVSGVSNKDMNAVWKIIEKSQGYAELIAELDQSSKIPNQLKKYKDIILKCWQKNGKVKEHQKKALLDEYNSTFTKLIQEVDKVESNLNKLITGKMAVFKQLYIALIVNVIVLFLFVAFTFSKYSKQRKLAEADLASARDSLNSLLNTIDSIIVSVDAECTVTQWNTAAEKYTKITTEKAVGQSLFHSLPFLTSYKNVITKVYLSHSPVELYRERIMADKERAFDISMNYTPALSCVVLQINDVTEHEMKDEQLRQSQKMRVVSNLIGSLANNFNNVLGAIIGTISMIKYSLKNADNPLEDIKSNIDVIESSAEKAEVMVQQLLGLAKEEDPELKPLDLNFIVRHLMKICENTIDKSIELNAELYSVKSIVNADPKQLEQVLLELCDNASQAIIANPDSETNNLTVSLDRICPDTAFRKKQPLAVKDAYWTISVADTGIGMSKDVIHSMFEPFYTTKENSTGLGLAVARDIITLHDGFIEVRSEEGEGSIITIYLPEYSGETNEQENSTVEPDYSEQIPLGEGVILVVDDEEVMRRTASNILKKLGYTVITANDGEEAIEIFREKSNQIILALLDYSMPKISGRDTYLAMKEINPNIKAVLVSGFDDDRINETLTVGINGFIKKPYSMVGLAQEVKQAIG
jgi:signal transduction histidine kinase